MLVLASSPCQFMPTLPDERPSANSALAAIRSATLSKPDNASGLTFGATIQGYSLRLVIGSLHFSLKFSLLT